MWVFDAVLVVVWVWVFDAVLVVVWVWCLTRCLWLVVFGVGLAVGGGFDVGFRPRE